MTVENAPAGHCGYCMEPLPENAVSDYFCGPGHQDLWHMNRSKPLGGRYGMPYMTWDDQSDQIRTTMTGVRSAFAEFGQAVQRCATAVDRLTEAAE